MSRKQSYTNCVHLKIKTEFSFGFFGIFFPFLLHKESGFSFDFLSRIFLFRFLDKKKSKIDPYFFYKVKMEMVAKKNPE